MSFSREPVAIINACVTLAQMLVAAIVVFGVDWSEAQTAALVAVLVAIGEVFKTLYARAQVTPVADPRDNAGNRLLSYDV